MKLTKAKSKTFTQQNTISFFDLFRYAETWDYVLLTIAIIVTFLKALVFPICIIIYSELVAMFIDRNLGIGTSSATITLPIFGGGTQLTNASHEENMAELKKDSIAFGILITLDAILMFITGVISVDMFNHIALKLVVRMRRKFFEATVRKDIGWHDTAKNQNFALRITDNMEKIRNGLAENMTHFLMLLFDIIISIVIAFIYGWKLTLAVFVSIPIAVFVNVFVAKYQSKLTASEQNSYAHASSVVEESISAIRTVAAFGGENIEAERYESRLVPGRKAATRKGMFSGLSDSVLKGLLFLSSAAAFWYGANLVVEDRHKDSEDRDYTPAILMIVSTGILVGTDHISRTAPFLEAFATARGSAKAIFEVIDAETKIDPLSSDGKVLNYGLKGAIEFQDVFFRYPSRDNVIVLRGFSLKIKAGQTVALVGYSGSGKSTCVQLLQRFYDPEFGRILVDGENVRNYNVGWLRQNIAVVGQEPVLFQGTIGENIRHGKENATQKEVEDAARAASAHDFIIGLPKSYNTHISEKGIQLSGGQRQRIAIARALIQNPKILLLDEATSALDYHSEKLVQAALDKASAGRTTIVVSHRLSAICNADHIVFIDAGKIIEQGTHSELMKLGGKYYEMVDAHKYDGKLEEEEPNVDLEDDIELTKARKEFLNDTEQLSVNGLHPLYLELNGENEKNVMQYKEIVSTTPETTSKETTRVTYIRTFLRIVRSARSEWRFLILGAICAGLYGCTQPIFAIVAAEFYGALAIPDDEGALRGTSTVALYSTVVGVIASIVGFTQTYLFNLAGVWLTTRMRSQTFRSILHQDMGWFDEKENSVGGLSARLAGDAAGVQAAIGFPLSNIIQAITNFICSFAIAFSYSWELSLICLCTSPFMVASIIFEAKFVTKSAVREKEILEDTSRMATETIAQIRTVAALHREAALIVEYEKDLQCYLTQIKQRLRFRGVINSLGMSILFFGYALTLAYGGVMCANGEIVFEDIMKIANSMLYGLFLLAQSLAFTPAFNAAIISAGRLYEIIDREPKIQSPPLPDDASLNGALTNGISVIAPSNKHLIEGVSYCDVNFTYPTRREQRVLHDFQLEVPQGKTVALVGPSGSGKSTCIQLLQRYYDPDAGKIFIGNHDDIHRDLKLSTLRRRLGIVSQEPSLFEKTIAENIAYGDSTRTVPLAEIIAAAKMANAHDFISALPAGYETCMGARGTQLSGGQKQRIAIARALVRNPKILLLDEATSALDLQSERVVQAALDDACSGRTCIVIAHRLATVQNADLICVMQNGRIAEQGNHPQLLAKNGIYAKLYQSQPKTD